jgi:hypothetical protein
MNKLTMMTTIVAGVGAILNIAGCGEAATESSAKPSASPAEEMVAYGRKVNAELAKHGADPMISETEIAQIYTRPVEEYSKELEMIRGAFPALQRYSSCVKEINELSEKASGRPILNKDSISEMFENFICKSNDGRQELLDAVQSVIPQFKVYTSLIREINDLSVKLGGNPYLNEDRAAEIFEAFIKKSSEDRQSKISEAQDVLKRLKEVKR